MGGGDDREGKMGWISRVYICLFIRGLLTSTPISGLALPPLSSWSSLGRHTHRQTHLLNKLWPSLLGPETVEIARQGLKLCQGVWEVSSLTVNSQTH